MSNPVIITGMLFSCAEEAPGVLSGAQVARSLACARPNFYVWSPSLATLKYLDTKIMGLCSMAPTFSFVPDPKFYRDATNEDVKKHTKNIAFCRSLEIWNCPAVTDDIADYLLERLRDATTVDVIECESITPRFFIKLCGAKNEVSGRFILPRSVRLHLFRCMGGRTRRRLVVDAEWKRQTNECSAIPFLISCLDERGAEDEFYEASIGMLGVLVYDTLNCVLNSRSLVPFVVPCRLRNIPFT